MYIVFQKQNHSSFHVRGHRVYHVHAWTVRSIRYKTVHAYTCTCIYQFMHTTPLLLVLGQHCCFGCVVTSSEMQTPKAQWGSFPERTLANLKQSYMEFQLAGGNIKHAKEFHNVISPVFFNIAVNQVCL